MSEPPCRDVGRYDAILDARDMRCPLPVLHARKALKDRPAGWRLLLIADDPVAAIDVPHFCSEAGHRLLAEERRDDARRFLIEKA